MPTTKPLQIVLFGQNFCALVDSAGELPEMSVGGPGCVQALAERLLRLGLGARELSLHRGGKAIGRVRVADAANGHTCTTT
jgi:hypothetical protein